ncbi:MAG: methyltransferase family protein [Myxococcaceae bacterium]
MGGALESRQGGARVRFPPPLVFLGFTAMGFALPLAGLPLRFALPRPVTLGAGIAALTAALLLCFVPALRLFRATGQDPRPWLPSPLRIVEGPYRFTRNPMYLGMTFTQSSLGLLFDNVWVLTLAAASLTLVHFIAVRPEEAYLTGEVWRAISPVHGQRAAISLNR